MNLQGLELLSSGDFCKILFTRLSKRRGTRANREDRGVGVGTCDGNAILFLFTQRKRNSV